MYVIIVGWLMESPSKNGKSYCKTCERELESHHKGLLTHATSAKHVANTGQKKTIDATPKVTSFAKRSIADKRKIAELKIAAFIAEHCSVASVDHLGQIVKNLDEKSEVIQDIKLHRTKCTALIINVIAPCFFDELMEDIGDSYYSMIIDESTATDKKKILCIMIRYFSKSKKKVITTFYRVVEVTAGDAETLYESFTNILKSDKLKVENLIGIGVDGANVMVGTQFFFIKIKITSA